MAYWIYKDTQGQWRWFLMAANGRKIANSGEGYWNKIRRDFPEQFNTVADIQEMIGPSAYLFRDRKTGERYSLRQLPPHWQEIIVLVHVGGLKLKEAAAIIGRSHGATRALLHRALNELKKLINR